MSKLAYALLSVLSALAFAVGSAEAQTDPRIFERQPAEAQPVEAPRAPEQALQLELFQNAPQFTVMTPAAPAAPPPAPRFIVRATNLYANNETGPDWPGSDEIYVVLSLWHPDELADSAGFSARTSVFEDFDTGERKSFRETQNCLTAALQDQQGSHGMTSAWHCHPGGDIGPLQFTVRLYEEDTWEDDLIGERTVQWSREELAAAMLQVGGGSEESIRIGGYTLTWRVERVS